MLLILFSIPLFSQFNSTIRSGRPGQAIGPYTVGEKVFQIQTGLNINTVKFAPTETKTLLHNTVLRYGILEKLELSSVINWQYDKISSPLEDGTMAGISNTQIGMRYNFLERNGAIPAVGLQGRLLLNAQHDEYQRENLGAQFILATGNKISDQFALITNWLVTWAGNGEDPQFSFVINVPISITEKIGAFVEVYGNLDEFEADYDAGFSYLITDDIQLDFSAGLQGNDHTDDWFIDFGISWRFHKR